MSAEFFNLTMSTIENEMNFLFVLLAIAAKVKSITMLPSLFLFLFQLKRNDAAALLCVLDIRILYESNGRR